MPQATSCSNLDFESPGISDYLLGQAGQRPLTAMHMAGSPQHRPQGAGSALACAEQQPAALVPPGAGAEIAHPRDLHLLQVRDLDNRFYENLGIVATTSLEKFNQEADVADTLPEEARLLLGDKDVFLNAIQVGQPCVHA